MTGSSPPNRNVLWAEALVSELAAGGLEAVCVAPGSRSTPLTVAFAEHPGVEVFSHLDERSAAYFALGRGRRTGDATALVCTSGTAAANFHPAVVEADRARVPLVVLTADRPPELRDSGANQTIDQEKFYGDAVRWYADLPEPEADERKVRSLRTTAARALATATGTPAGPVHLNCPFRKPLEPVEVPGDVPDSFAETLAGRGRDGAYVDAVQGRPTLADADVDRLASALADADRPILVAGPADPPDYPLAALSAVASALEAPILADPLSGVRFGPHVDEGFVCGGYDAYLGGAEGSTDDWRDPDVVLRMGASPTSKALRNYLRDADARQFLVDPAGEWREATFTATDLVVAQPEPLLEALGDRLGGRVDAGAAEAWHERFRDAEEHHWRIARAARERRALESDPFEGAVLAAAFEGAPDPATVFVSNSMPVRDADRFARPRTAALTVLANRGASGIDGIVSTALGAGSATEDPLVCVTGDLAYYHDSNGLLALERCGVDATIVLVNNDGGGIFHMLPIEDFDPPFTGQFRTPHGLDFEPTGDLYGLDYERVSLAEFADAYREVVGNGETTVLEVTTDAEASHRVREALERRVRDAVADDDR